MLLALVLALCRAHGAFYVPLLDCDESYNYWDPLNFLIRHFGKQTWEYDPQFALRSYAFLYPWALIKYPLSVANVQPYHLFYAVRCILALAFTLAESKLASQLDTIFKSSYNIGGWFLLAQILSPGMYIASVAYLPNSIALLFTILSTTYILKYFHSINLMNETDSELSKLESAVVTDEKSIDGTPAEEDLNIEVVQSLMKIKVYTLLHSIMTKNFTLAILFISIAGFVCWPFSLVLILPLVVFALLKSLFPPKSTRLNGKFSSMSTFFTLILTGISCAFFVPYFISQIDFLFYHKNVIFSYNLFSYNVLSNNVGPELFGLEDASYYLKNLLLNFHLILPIAALNLILIPSNVQLFSYKFPLIIWLAIFQSQGHKEERFMYPVYHLISISFAQFMSCPTFNSNKFLKFVKISLNLSLIGSMVVLGGLRINNLIQSYTNYQTVFKPLSLLPAGNVCIGREWYHYPSSFFLGDDQRLKFTKSNFNGLLPGDFKEDGTGSFAPVYGFNNENKSQPTFYIKSIDECDYFIDTTQETDELDETNLNEWDIIQCENVIDYNKSSGLNRILGIQSFVQNYIIEPWGELQKDLTSIEVNRKVMEMYGIERDGREMYTELYQWLQPRWLEFISKIGDEQTMKVCLAQKKKN